ncbi:MAG: RnfABCDGE type electron transport complex subunit B [Lachnospiraceae bacterium]|nr:RnfABCDGE type electron transport complex subunit B [Lachnospiraceae bacterium]
MNLTAILTAAAFIGGVGLIIGILLTIAGKVFYVKVDEKVVAVRNCLPGNNCGGCGFPGCDGLAEAIAKGEAPVDGCPVGGSPVAGAISDIMGVAAPSGERMVAFVKCSGTCDKTSFQYHYYGNMDCWQMLVATGSGEKGCQYGCMGYGSCVAVCPFDAIRIQNGRAAVDPDKCKACGKCLNNCPRHLIELVPVSAQYRVRCSSHDKGKAVKAVCRAGCIGCGLCAKNCEQSAITLTDNLAYINQELCIGCGKCAEKCPVKIIG